jgi:hypothetical protein
MLKKVLYIKRVTYEEIQRVIFIERLSSAGWAASLVIVQQQCCLLLLFFMLHKILT